MKQSKNNSAFNSANLSKLIAFSETYTKRRFNNFVKALDLSENHVESLIHLYQNIDSNALNEKKTKRFLKDLDGNMAYVLPNLPKNIQKKWQNSQKLRHSLSLDNELKVVLPIIPYILDAKIHIDLIEPFFPIWFNVVEGQLFENQTASRGLDFDTEAIRKVIRTISPENINRKVEIIRTKVGDFEAYQFTCGAAICVDGAPDAYGPDGKGIDNLSAAGHGTTWWGIVADKNGKPILKEDGFYISTTAYTYVGPWGAREDVQERYVNPHKVPYSVLSAEFMKHLKDNNHPPVVKGDLIHVKNNKTGIELWTAFLEARNEDDRIGEVSKMAAEALGINSDPKSGGQEDDIVYTVFPNTAPIGRMSNDDDAIDYISRNGFNIEMGIDVDKDPPYIKTAVVSA